jgi:copper homeostasis protein (lipoprotein)
MNTGSITTGQLATGLIAGGLLASVLVGPAVARAGSISGSASTRERTTLPPDAVFEAVLIDRAIADDPEVGDQQGPLGPLPASWRGDLTHDSGTTRWQVDLASDGTFQLRQSTLSQAQQRQSAVNSQDDIGRWRLEPGSNRLLLQGGREAPVVLQPLDNGASLRKLDLKGQPLTSSGNDRLQRLAAADPIEPRLHLAGMFRYMADAASIRLCATGTNLPVAMEADYLPLERAYLTARPADAPGEPMLVNLEALISNRPSAEPGRGLIRTLVVERFVAVHPGQSCPEPAASKPPAKHRGLVCGASAGS